MTPKLQPPSMSRNPATVHAAHHSLVCLHKIPHLLMPKDLLHNSAYLRLNRIMPAEGHDQKAHPSSIAIIYIIYSNLIQISTFEKSNCLTLNTARNNRVNHGSES